MDKDVWDAETIAAYTAAGWWDDESLGDRLEEHARTKPDGVAFVDNGVRAVTWAQHHEASMRLAGALAAHPSDAPVAIFMRDGWLLHAAYMAVEYAGLVAVGIGPRAGDREIAHILATSGAERLVTGADHRGRATADLVSDLVGEHGVALAQHVVVEDEGGADGGVALTVAVDGETVPLPSLDAARDAVRDRRLGPNELFFINSTSGTTGLPKCVMHTQNRWKFFHRQCIQFSESDVFLVAVPAPFGFGIWMSHVTPLMLGAPTVLLDEFTIGRVVELIDSCRVTVLAAVTTQVLMMLSTPALAEHDISTLRVIQTGGERVPFERSAQLERATGAHVLQFYGSNESGCLSRTEIDQPIERRLGTAGRVIPEMHVRVIGDDGGDLAGTGRAGRSACKGPAMSPGYYRNPEANAELFRPDGWMYLGDIVSVDAEGFLTVEGRVADFIIRGGHNISAVTVEEEVLSHPSVREVAVVGMPDETFGERVCAFVVTSDRAELTLEALTEHLAGRGISKTMWPERLVELDALPRNSGGKVAKKQLRDMVASPPGSAP